MWGPASSRTRSVRGTQAGENSLTGVTVTRTGTSAGDHLEIKELAQGTQTCPRVLNKQTWPYIGGKVFWGVVKGFLRETF